VRIDGADPEKMWRGAPAGHVRVHARANLRGKDLRTLAGSAHIDASGRIGDTRVDALAIDAEPRGGGSPAQAVGRAPPAAVDIAGTFAVDPPAVRSAKVVARVDQVERFLGGAASPAHGTVRADVTVAGPPHDLAVTGSIDGSALAFGDIRAT